MKLLKSQLNIFYDALDIDGFNVSQFELQTKVISDNYSVVGSCLSYKPENYYFNCGEQDEVYYCVYSPSTDKLLEEIRALKWLDIERVFVKWLFALKKEINQVDKWSILKQSISTVNIRVIDSNEKFTYEEVLEVEKRIKLLKYEISNISLTTEQILLINQKLDHLAELSKDSNKFDWGTFFIGTIMNIIIALTISTENGKLLWEAIKKVFNNYILLD